MNLDDFPVTIRFADLNYVVGLMQQAPQPPIVAFPILSRLENARTQAEAAFKNPPPPPASNDAPLVS